VIGFTGGECFLLGRELDDHVERAARLGFSVSCSTNGYWAVNPKAASDRMHTLKAAGLDTVSFSTGEMHARFVPPERIIFGAFAACDSGISNVSISIETFEDTTFDWRCITEHRDIATYKKKGLTIFSRPWIDNAGGNGTAQLRHNSRYGRFRKENVSGCGTILDTIAVTPGLRVMACCGYPIEYVPELTLGSVANSTLREVLDSSEDDLIKIWLHVAGPERMLMFVKDYLPDYKLPRQYVDICQTCVHVHRDQRAMNVLREHLDEVEKDIRWLYAALRDRAEGKPSSNGGRRETALER